jgi:hypothetical protein
MIPFVEVKRPEYEHIRKPVTDSEASGACRRCSAAVFFITLIGRRRSSISSAEVTTACPGEVDPVRGSGHPRTWESVALVAPKPSGRFNMGGKRRRCREVGRHEDLPGVD